MNPKEFFGEAKRRNVYKVAAAYGVVGWLLIQVATQVFPFLEIPNWMIRLVVLISAIRISDCADIRVVVRTDAGRIKSNRGCAGERSAFQGARELVVNEIKYSCRRSVRSS